MLNRIEQSSVASLTKELLNVNQRESVKMKCKNNDYTFLFQCINISRVSRKQFELSPSVSNNFLVPRQMLMHEKMYDPYTKQVVNVTCAT